MREAGVQLVLLHEDLGLVRTVRVFGMEEIDRQRFDEHLESYHQGDVRRMRSEGSIRPTTLLLVGSGSPWRWGRWATSTSVARPARLSLGAVLILAIAIGLLAWAMRRWLDRREALHARADPRSPSSSTSTEAGTADARAPVPAAVEERIDLRERHRRRFRRHGRSLEGVSAEIRAGTRNADHGPRRGRKQALVCLLPRLLDPRSGRVRIDGHRPAGRDARIAPRPGRHRPPGRPDLQRLGRSSTSAWATRATACPGSSRPPRTPTPTTSSRTSPRATTPTSAPSATTSGLDEQYRIALARAVLHDPSILIIEEPHRLVDDEIKPLIDDTRRPARPATAP